MNTPTTTDTALAEALKFKATHRDHYDPHTFYRKSSNWDFFTATFNPETGELGEWKRCGSIPINANRI